MPSSSRTIPGTVNHLGIGRATIHICGQASNHTNAGWAITPFMYNEEEYRVSPLCLLLHVLLTFPFSMLATRTELNTLRLMTSIVIPIPMTQIRTGLKTFTATTSSMLSVGWRAVS